ncbi:hypothetical protein AB0H00_04005 [Nocardia sp. NPDC023852]|uniref:hypothetical protein n=1 Tax=Nocardia sp. NPDC023852 TaxID=3154697 RepID=UPI0033F571E9
MNEAFELPPQLAALSRDLAEKARTLKERAEAIADAAVTLRGVLAAFERIWQGCSRVSPRNS